MCTETFSSKLLLKLSYASTFSDISFTMRRGGGGADFRTSGGGVRSETVAVLLGKDFGEVRDAVGREGG